MTHFTGRSKNARSTARKDNNTCRPEFSPFSSLHNTFSKTKVTTRRLWKLSPFSRGHHPPSCPPSTAPPPPPSRPPHHHHSPLSSLPQRLQPPTYNILYLRLYGVHTRCPKSGPLIEGDGAGPGSQIVGLSLKLC